MFSRLPQKFTAPFAILSDEAKLAFRNQPNGISKLATARNIAENDSYWDQYITLFDSASDVFSLVTPHDIRRALSDAPENVATLIRTLSARLFNLVSDHTFPSPSNASMTALANSFIKPHERNTTKEVLNCLRVLQRVLPVVFEVEGEASVFELEVLWKKREAIEAQDREEQEQTPQFVIDDDEDSEDEEAKSPSVPKIPELPSPKPTQLPSLAERLFSCLVDLLFCCGFTLPPKLQVDHYKINYVIWEKGVGSTSDPGPNHPYDGNKTEVLRLVLVLLSRQIYIPPSSLLSKPSLYTLDLVQRTSRRDVLTILCSLLNTVMSTGFQSITIGSMTGKLPYNHLVFKGEDSRTTLVTVCFQILCVLLDFQSGSARDKPSNTEEGSPPVPTSRTNAFRYFLMKLHRTQDFTFIMNGIISILEQQIAVMSNVLPGARKSVPYMFETIVFLWKIIDLNAKFRIHLLESDRGMDLVAYMLCYNLEIKDKPEQHGLCRIISNIIQTLSAEPAFGRALSRPIKSQLPTKWYVGGTAGDFFINSVYATIATTSGALNSIYPSLIIALSNSAPYLKGLNVTSSARLVQLFTSFANPLFLLADGGHPRLLFFMLEVFNSVILHNLARNPHLIYNILTSHKTFEALGTFTLAKGLREIKRTKDDATHKVDGKNKMPTRDAEEPDAQSEKTRLMENEELRMSSIDQPPEQPQAMESSEALPSDDSPASPVSEKARGKMKERSRSSSVEIVDPAAAAAVGRNGFVPTQEWVTSWQQGLPMDCIMLLITELLPKVQRIQASHHRATSVSAIIDFLGNVNLEEVLPTAPPLTPRRFMWTDASIVLLTSLIWGEIYVRGMTPLGIWNATHVRLFYVKHTQAQQRQITEAVSNVVDGILRRNSETNLARQRNDRS